MIFRSIGSFNAPGAAASASRRPASILLDEQVYIADRRNDETIATAHSTDGHTLKLSFWIHHPPALSYFCVHRNKTKDADFEDWPEVVGAEGRFVLFRASFASSDGRDEYFMYTAGDGESSASLDPVPLPDGYRLPRLVEFGIVPRCHQGHYLVAALCLDMGPFNYRLHIYSSEDERWRSIRLPNPCPEINKVITSKVVTIGEGVLGWVDFQHGMLVCDLRQEPIDAHYIPLPDALPENIDKLEELWPGPSARRFRDLTCVNGVITLVEVEHRVIVTTEKPVDPSNKDFVCNSYLIMSRKRKRLDGKPKQVRSWDGWRVVTWSRTVSSTGWSKGCSVDVDDILMDESMYSSLLYVLRGNTAGKLAFRDLYSAFPTLSTCGDDILYLRSMVEFRDSKGCVVAIHLGNKTVKALGSVFF